MKLLTTNTKIKKGSKRGFSTQGIHFSPFNKSGYQVCKWASKGCAAACLDTAGRGQMSNVQLARINKTKFFFEQKETFKAQLHKEIEKAVAKAKREKLTPCFRLNLTSDLPWEKITIADGKTIFQLFPNVQFYDYTKGFERMKQFINGKGWPDNYYLTFSRSESNDFAARAVLDLGGNVAMVFRNGLPLTWQGFPVIDGDKDDLRFLDKPFSIVGLVEKGKAKNDDLGFVIDWRE